MMKSLLVFVAAAALGTSAASADNLLVTAPAPSARVSYADLDLGSESGRSRLQQRIRGAAADLCLEDNIDPLEVRLQRRECFTAAVTDGYRQLDELLAARISGTAYAATALTIGAR